MLPQLFVLLLLSQGQVIVRAPGTGEMPSQAIVEQPDGTLHLVEIEKGGETRELATIGRRLRISDQALARMIPSNRPIIQLKMLRLPNALWKIFATTGLRRDPSARDAYTGMRVYTRQDDLLFLRKEGDNYKLVTKRSFDEIDDLQLVPFSRISGPFIVASTFEGRHNALLHIFRIGPSGTVLPLNIPEPKVDGRWQEQILNRNDSKLVSISVKQFGSFSEAPGKKAREVLQTVGWDDKTHSFRRLSEEIEYE